MKSPLDPAGQPLAWYRTAGISRAITPGRRRPGVVESGASELISRGKNASKPAWLLALLAGCGVIIGLEIP